MVSSERIFSRSLALRPRTHRVHSGPVGPPCWVTGGELSGSRPCLQVLDVTSLWSTQPDKRMQVVAVRFKGTNGENVTLGEVSSREFRKGVLCWPPSQTRSRAGILGGLGTRPMRGQLFFGCCVVEGHELGEATVASPLASGTSWAWGLRGCPMVNVTRSSMQRRVPHWRSIKSACCATPRGKRAF